MKWNQCLLCVGNVESRRSWNYSAQYGKKMFLFGRGVIFYWFLLFDWLANRFSFLKVSIFADSWAAGEKKNSCLFSIGRREKKLEDDLRMTSRYKQIGHILRSREKWSVRGFSCWVWLLELWNSNIRYLSFPCCNFPFRKKRKNPL